jgi:hypothetical protein
MARLLVQTGLPHSRRDSLSFVRTNGSPFKTEIVSVRMSPDELGAVGKRAHDCGKCLSTYMRIVALGSIPRARPRRIEQEAVYQLGKIGNNLNQLTRVANSTGRLGEAHRLQQILDELLDAVRTLA